MISKNLFLMIVLIIFFLCFVVLSLVRKDKIPIKYAIVWLFAIVILLFIILVPNLMTKISNFLGFELLSNMILSLFIGILLFITLALTVMISSQKKKITQLIQEVSILKKEVEEKK